MITKENEQKFLQFNEEYEKLVTELFKKYDISVNIKLNIISNSLLYYAYINHVNNDFFSGMLEI